jgi:tetratricopeptide (TPR) repeat protein
VLAVLRALEANLLHARHLARRHTWWDRVISAMQGLRCLYKHTGRQAEWRRLVEEVVPDFTDPGTDGPLPGREAHWSEVTGDRIWLAFKARQWGEAERLLHLQIDQHRRRAAPVLAADPTTWDGGQRKTILNLAVSLQHLGSVQCERGRPECVATLQEALGLCQRIGDQSTAAVCAFNFGDAYLGIGSLRDLGQAEHWYRQSLEMSQEHQRHDRAKCLGQLGRVSRARFEEARSAGQPKAELLRLLNEALRYCQEALGLTPADAVPDLEVLHNDLGVIYANAGDLDQALPHFQESIRYAEALGDLYGAASTRHNVAVLLAEGGRLGDARQYAEAALRNFEGYGDRAADRIQLTREWIQVIDKRLQAGGG